MTDEELIKKYPWLNAYEHAYLYYVGAVDEDVRKKFDGFCVLNDMPDGWRTAFGEQMCEEINQALINAGWNPKDYKISQIKEKFGSLRWYDEDHPKEVEDIIDKYETLSYTICGECGKPATCISTGWIFPYCFDCLPPLIKESKHYLEVKHDE